MSCSWKSTTTRPKPSGAWTSSSTPLRRPTRKPRRFSKASSSHSRIKGKRNGETEPDQPEQEARKAGRAICHQARRAEGHGRGHEGPRRGTLRRPPEAGQAASQFLEG